MPFKKVNVAEEINQRIDANPDFKKAFKQIDKEYRKKIHNNVVHNWQTKANNNETDLNYFQWLESIADKQIEEEFIKKYMGFKEAYKNNPVKFCEEMLGIELMPYQKLLLKVLSIKENI